MFAASRAHNLGAAKAAGAELYNKLSRYIVGSSCSSSSLAVPASESAGYAVSSSQLILLNQLGILPSVARHWDDHAVDAELRRAAGSGRGAPTAPDGPTAVQQAIAQRAHVELPPGATRQAAAASLAAVRPPSVPSLAVLYGVLGYDGAVPSSEAAARQLVEAAVRTRPLSHPLDLDLSPVALSQMSELQSGLGYIGRPPFSYACAQLLAAGARTVLRDVEREARLQPLQGLHPHQAALIRYLRRRRAPPGTRGLPAVADLPLGDCDPQQRQQGGGGRGAEPEPGPAAAAAGSGGGPAAGRAGGGVVGVSRLAAARNLLQLLQNHELSASPRPGSPPLEALRALGHCGPVPPTTGEAIMLAEELRARCVRPSQAQLAALRAAGYGSGSGVAPVPDSVAHVQAIWRVMRRADREAATPATRAELRELQRLQRRTPAAPHAAAAAAASAAALGGGRGGGGGLALGACPSRLEVRAAAEELPLSEEALERLLDLGWSGPTPPNHGSAEALEAYLSLHRANASAAGNGSSQSAASAAAAPAPPAARATAMCRVDDSSPQGHYRRTGQQQQPQPQQRLGREQQRQQAFVARLGRTEEEALVKIQIRGMFPGAVSEWYLPSMCREEAEHVLGCLLAARRAVLERVSYDNSSYDEYVERWAEAEVEGEWWGMEGLWH